MTRLLRVILLVLTVGVVPVFSEDASRSSQADIASLLQYLHRLQTSVEHARTATEKLATTIRGMVIKAEQDDQRQYRDLLATTEASVPSVLVAPLDKEWRTALETLRHQVSEVLDRSASDEQGAQQLVTDADELALQFRTLHERIKDVFSLTTAAEPPSQEPWLRQRESIKADLKQLDQRQTDIIHRAKSLMEAYRLRKTDWMRTRSRSLIEASLTTIKQIRERAEKTKRELEIQQVHQREETERSEQCAAYLLKEDTPSSGTAVEHVNRGSQLEAGGNLKEAITEYCVAVRINPDYQSAKDRLSSALRLASEDPVEVQRRADAIAKARSERKDRETREAREATKQAERERPFKELLGRHHAVDLSDRMKSRAFHVNSFAYQGKQVLLRGLYHRNIGPSEAVVSIVEVGDHLVVWETKRNLAELPFDWLWCVVKVLGVTRIQQGVVEREIPHVKEVECLK